MAGFHFHHMRKVSSRRYSSTEKDIFIKLLTLRKQELVE